MFIGIHPRRDDPLEAVVVTYGPTSHEIVLRLGDLSLFVPGQNAEAVASARAIADALTAAADELQIDLNTRAYLAQHPHTPSPDTKDPHS